MTESRRPPRRGRTRPSDPAADGGGEDNPYREGEPTSTTAAPPEREAPAEAAPPARRPRGEGAKQSRQRQAPAENREAPGESPDSSGGERTAVAEKREAPTASEEPRAPQEASPPPPPAPSNQADGNGMTPVASPSGSEGQRPEGQRYDAQQSGGHRNRDNQNARRGRRNRGRGRRDPNERQHNDRPHNDRPQGERPHGDRPQGERQQHDRHQGGSQSPAALVAIGETTGWFDPARDGGFIRRAQASYLADAGDAYVAPHIVRQHGIRKSDEIYGSIGRDSRGRTALIDVLTINGVAPQDAMRRPEFNTLIATYPERKLFLETGRPAKAGNELIRRAIDLIAPIGYGQRALIVAPARAGKTTLLHAITEGIALNHPEAALLILLVDERPEEVSEAISWGVGEVIASSFDQPAARHVEVTEMVLERSRRLVEQGRDVVIVLDSLTRMARAHNTSERGTGRTMSGGLDAQAMAKPKAFFGSARAVAPSSGGGSLTIIATALIETGSRMDDVIFEEFKGTGNCEIKLDRSLAEKRIYPAIDIATSGTRREEKLFRPDQLEHVYTLRRGLGQMPPQSGMEWLIKRIANTPNNDQLLSGL